jgi:serralysin
VAGTATIVGGDTVQLYLNPAEYQLAQDALTKLGQGFSDGDVLTNLGSPPIKGDLNIYQVPGGGFVQLPKGAQGIVLTGSNPTILVGQNTKEVLIGNQGDDIIAGAGGSGTIIAGDGNNIIYTGQLPSDNGNKNPGDFEIDVGKGNNVIFLQGGNDTVNALAGGNDTVFLSDKIPTADIEASGNVTIVDQSSSHDNTALTLSGGGNFTVFASAPENLDQTGNGSLNFTGVGNDTITLGGGNDTVYDAGSATLLGGGGENEITIGGSSASIGTSGNDNITLTHSAVVTVSGGGTDTVHAVKGTEVDQLGKGNLDFIGQGNDTIFLGSGNDTITDAGAATVYGGAANFSFTGGTGNELVVAGTGNATVTAGSGKATLIGGSGDNVFTAGSGSTKILAGIGGHDTFLGGTGHDTMSGLGAASNVFEFDTSHAGGSHTITDFSEGRDKIDLAGYDSATALSNAQVVGGNTILTLGDGTQITLTNFTGLKASDFTS